MFSGVFSFVKDFFKEQDIQQQKHTSKKINKMMPFTRTNKRKHVATMVQVDQRLWLSAQHASLYAAKTRPKQTYPEMRLNYPYFATLGLARDLSWPASITFWAFECMAYVADLPVEEVHRLRFRKLKNVYDFGDVHELSKQVFDGMSNPGGIATTNDPAFNFWIKFSWLACWFCDADEDEMNLDTEPDYLCEKELWWTTHMTQSPFFCATRWSHLNTPSDMVHSFESEHRAASEKAARTQKAAEKAAEEEQDSSSSS